MHNPNNIALALPKATHIILITIFPTEQVALFTTRINKAITGTI